MRAKNSFPGIPRNNTKRDVTQDAVHESIEVLTGQRGNGDNRALLVKDLVNLDELKRKQLIKAAQGNANAGGLPINIIGGVEPPHAPANLSGTGGFTFIALMWGHPTYRGHAYAEIYRSDTDVFADAVMIATEVSDVFSESVNMGSSYYYWVRFVNDVNVKGPLHGANGLLVETEESATAILEKLEGKIGNSHLGNFLSTQVGKIAGIGSDVDQLNLDMPQLLIDVPQLMIDVPPLKQSVPLMEAAVFGEGGAVETAKKEANDAKAISETVLATNESLALNLIDASLLSDINWGNNTTQLAALNTSINGIQATIDSNFYTMAEADSAIAAAATTIQTMIEENGTALTGDIALTYYTKTTTNNAIAAADTALKAAIEDPTGTSLGATLNDDYYTSTNTDEAIAAAGLTLKAEIEDPLGTSLGADLITNHYTKAKTDEVIAQADLVLKADIENTSGNSLGATLYNGYLTSSDTNSAISAANTALKALIEDPNGASIGADLQNNYYTKTTADEATAASINALKSAIENPEGTSLGADLVNNHYTKTTADLAISEKVSALKATIEDPAGTSVGANLATNFYTKTKANEAIAAANTALKTAVEDPQGLSIGADLYNNYYTKATADTAISEAGTALKAEIENPLGTSLGADLQNNYYTKITADTAIAEAATQLKTIIEDVNGSSIGADLYNNYYTKVTANEATANANELLKAEIENPEGSSIGATLYSLYETKADNERSVAKAVYELNSTFEPALEGMIETALAGDIEAGRQRDISANFIATQKTLSDQSHALAENLQVLESQFGESNATALTLSRTVATNIQATALDLLRLASSIGSVGADLEQNYYTSANADEAISQATTTLKSTIEDPLGASLGADLINNHYTKTKADEAIAAAITILKSVIEDPTGTSLGADLVNSYYTKIAADTAIATANTTLQSLIEDIEGNSVGASLQTLSETVATNDEQWAMWGVKATVSEITASFGLLNDGVDPIFAIKGAKLAIITSQEPDVATPVFGVVGDKTVIKSALIDEAHIQTLVTDDLLSNRVVVGSKLTTPSINYDVETGTRSNNFSLDPSGNMVAKSAVLESVTIKDDSGNVMMSSTGMPWSSVTGIGKPASNATANQSDETTNAAISSAQSTAIAKAALTGENQTLYTTVGLEPDLMPIGAPNAKGFSTAIGSSHYSNYNDLIPVRRGERLHLEMWATQTGSTVRAYMGIERYDRNKRPITGNSGTVYIGLANTLLTKSWVKYTGTTVLPTSHTPYNGSDGGEVCFVRVRLLFNYATSGQAYYSAFRLYRDVDFSDISGVTKPANNATANQSDAITNNAIGEAAKTAELTRVTGAGAFAGLSKILSTNITTYIESGSIGSAQINQAYINTLFGNNASFLGTVYANKISGDLVDGDVVSVSAAATTVKTTWTTIKTVTIQRNVNYDVWLTIADLVPTMDVTSGFGALFTRLKYSTQTGKAVSITKGASNVTVYIQVKKIELYNAETPVETRISTQNAILQMFRKGSGFIV